MMRKILSFLVPLLPLILVLVWRVSFPSAAEELQFKIFDQFQRLRPRPYQKVPVSIIDIDDESLAKLGQWPWPRTQLADLISRLAQNGAAVIALDIVLAEPDRTSPANVLPLWPKTQDLQAILSHIEKMPDHDRILAEAMKSIPAVASFSLTEEVNPQVPLSKAGFVYAGENPLEYVKNFRGAIINLKPIEAAAKGNGSFNVFVDADGVIRRLPLLFRLNDKLYPSLVLEAVRVAQNATTYLVKSSGSSGETNFGKSTGIVSVKAGRHVIPTDANGRALLYDTNHQPERFLSAWKIFADRSEAKNLQGHLVLIGSTAAGLKDIRSTALSPVMAGVEIHAQMIEQILLGNFLQRPDWADGAELLYLIFFGLLLTLLMGRTSAGWSLLLAVTAVAAAFAVSWHSFTKLHLLLDPVFASAASLLIYLSSSLLNYLRTEKDRRQVRNAFSRYMSPMLLKKLAEDPDQLKLGGEIKELTLMFSDIRGFTTFSEQMSAQELIGLINDYMTPMTDIILKTNGTIDKYMGDCIMAFWNAPLDDAAHAAHACEAGLKMCGYLTQWNEERKAAAEKLDKKFMPIHIGVGINSGECCVGNMGSQQRFDYSALGDDVNLASRLESLCKMYGVDIVIGPKTHELAPGFAALELDLIQVKGKTKPVRIFALMGNAGLKNNPEFAELESSHQQMLETYRAKDWRSAQNLLARCREMNGFSAKLAELYRIYEERLRDLAEHPPASDWSGVYIALSK